MTRMEAEDPDVVDLKKDGAPSCFHKMVTEVLNRKFQQKWICRSYVCLL
jgi:hypothetical protein